jgi:hypothetical protein
MKQLGDAVELSIAALRCLSYVTNRVQDHLFCALSTGLCGVAANAKPLDSAQLAGRPFDSKFPAIPS